MVVVVRGRGRQTRMDAPTGIYLNAPYCDCTGRGALHHTQAADDPVQERGSAGPVSAWWKQCDTQARITCGYAQILARGRGPPAG